MAVHRITPNCLKCNKPMKSVHNNMGNDFVGDTFSHWEHDGECRGEKTNSENLDAKKVMGTRRTDVIAFDQPCELNYHCPICKYKHMTDGEPDERLHWSEYNGFIWCSVCNLDIPSVFCIRDLKHVRRKKGTKKWKHSGMEDAIEGFLVSVHQAKIDSPLKNLRTSNTSKQ